MNARSLLLVMLAVMLSPLAAGAADWPQWRGPHRDGISKETGLLQEWPEKGPKLLWEVKNIDFGYSTPSVVGERIYLLSNKGEDNEYVQALSIKDGSQIWAKKLSKVGPNKFPSYPGARSTPTVEGDVMYVLSSDGVLACLETDKGEIRWQKNVRKEFGGKPGVWAYSESPLIDGDVLVCTPGGKEATIVALDKKNGEVIWKCPVPGGDTAGYASVVISHAGGVKQYVQFLGNGVVGVDAKKGTFLWRYKKTAQGSPANIPTPVVHDAFVYTGSGKGGAGLVKVVPGKEGMDAEQVYYNRDLPTAIGGAILLKDYLYGTNSDGLICAEYATGKVKWDGKGSGAASLCYADNRLYLHGENGTMLLVDPSPEAYKEKGRFSPPNQPKHDQSKAWAYPVVANGRLYIRDLGMLWCYDVKAPAGG